MEENKFSGWGLVEIMGHQRVAGRLSEQSIAGANLLRVDVPIGDGPEDFRTEFVGGHSIYRLHPTDEKTARVLARSMGAKPTYSYEVDRQLRIEAPHPSHGDVQDAIVRSDSDDDDDDRDDSDRDDDFGGDDGHIF
jgi:hypothetical protein